MMVTNSTCLQKPFPRQRSDCISMEKTQLYDFHAGIRSSGNQRCAYSWLSGFKMRSKRIDVIARIIFPVMFAMFNLIYWTSYLWTWSFFSVLNSKHYSMFGWFIHDCFAQPFLFNPVNDILFPKLENSLHSILIGKSITAPLCSIFYVKTQRSVLTSELIGTQQCCVYSNT